MADEQISPGNSLPPSRLCPPHLRPCFPYRYRTLKIIAFSSSRAASYAISVRRASILPAASFRSHLTVGTLAVRLTLTPVGRVEDLTSTISTESHLQVSAPCRAHNQKGKPRKTDLPLIKNDIKKVKHFVGLYGWISYSLSRYCPFG